MANLWASFHIASMVSAEPGLFEHVFILEMANNMLK